MYGDADIDYMVGHDFAVTVVYQAQSVSWQLDERGDEPLRGHVSGVSGTELSIYGRAGSLTGLAIGQAITVDGIAYVIRNIQPEDQQMVRVFLRK